MEIILLPLLIPIIIIFGIVMLIFGIAYMIFLLPIIIIASIIGIIFNSSFLFIVIIGLFLIFNKSKK